MPPDSWNPDGSDGALQPTPSTTLQRPQSNSASSLSSPSVSHEDQLDRQMLRHLMSRYSPESLARLMQEENLSPQLANNGNDGASVYTSSTYSSVRSDDAPSLFESSASSVRTLSDTSSARGSIISNVSARTAKFLSRKTSEADTDADSLTPSVNKQKGTFLCGFCSEEGIQKTCTRKNDLKRHIEDFHNTNAQWHCRQRGCGKVFDWQTVYKTHLKNAHGGSRSTSVDDARVELCQQTVFACGFANCIQVFEAGSDAESPVKFKEYVAHVVKHLDEGSNSGEWDYSTRIRNLMRQSGVLRAWTSEWPEEERNKLVWAPQTSGVLRKRLETRHLGDLRMLVQYAIALGSNPQGVPEYHHTFNTPVKDECQMQIHGHGRIRINSQPPPPPPQHHHQQQQQQPQPQQQQQEQDPFSFKISRGTGQHPNLANYYASRRMQAQFSARPAVRAGRSARPPVNTMPAHSMPQQQQQNFSQPGTPAPNMFDPNGFYHPQQQSPQPQQGQYMGIPSADGGIIADDLRSLRSMATTSSGHSNGAGDVDMADVMGDSSYLTQPQQGYGMHNGQGVKMEDGNGFEYMGNY